MNVSEFLVERLVNAGLKHVFGVPGDYVLDFYKLLSDNEKIQVINNTDENHTGFAADAYARVKGIGCAVVTYSVGASKVINATQCAYAERSPLIIISGAPGLNERNEGFLLHHMVGSFNSQKLMFDHITCASIVLDNPATAGYEIDRAFEIMNHEKRPIYIELPRDVAKKPISYDVYKQGTPVIAKSDPENLQEAIGEVLEWLKVAENPAILAGEELARYDMGQQMLAFAERLSIPIACTILSKSTIAEDHPLFAGIYSGSSSPEPTRKLIEESDCLLLFGAMLTDMSLCFRPAKFKKRQVVTASINQIKIRNHTFTDIRFDEFCRTLFKCELPPRPMPARLLATKEKVEWEPTDKKISTKRFFEKVDSILTKNNVVLADIGDCLFGSTDLTVHHRHGFLSPAFYTSMGSAIPGAVGAQLALPYVRPIVLVGDGAFQMSLSELSTIAEHKLNPIIFVLNNDGYTTERFLLDGKFNDIRRWDYHKVVEMIRYGEGRVVQNEQELDDAVTAALESKTLFVINVLVDRRDISPALQRMTEALSKRI